MIFQALSKCQYSQGHHRLKRGFSKPDQLITFLIGKADDIKPFLVHKETVCHYSPVLRAAFISDSVEGQAQTYRLEDTSEGAFRFFAQWIHHQRFELDYHKDAAEKRQDSEEIQTVHVGAIWLAKIKRSRLFSCGF
jgi:hypothetical protein